MRKLLVCLFLTTVGVFAQTPTTNAVVDLTWVNATGNVAGTLTVVERALGSCSAPGAFTAITLPTGVAGTTFVDAGVFNAGQIYCYHAYHITPTGKKSVPSPGADAPIPENAVNPPSGMGVTRIRVNI